MHILIAEPLPFDANQVTPGVIGFAVTAAIAVAVILLLWDFNRRVRRINDRADVKERIEAELAQQRASEQRDAAPTTVDPVHPVDPGDEPRPAP